jgi:hypothetical protein
VKQDNMIANLEEEHHSIEKQLMTLLEDEKKIEDDLEGIQNTSIAPQVPVSFCGKFLTWLAYRYISCF